MKNAIKAFWVALLEKVNKKINQWLSVPKSRPTVDAGDDSRVNFFAMIVRKVMNRALMGAQYSVTTNSAQAEPLKELCENLSENIYKITANMIGGAERSECWVVPSFITVGGENKLVHSYADGSRICITAVKENGQIAECYIILESVKRKDKIYFLCRKHELNDNGDLTISYFTADEEANEVVANVPEWESLVNQMVTYSGANIIGIGRYKSPVVPLNNYSVYGVPLNFGCAEIERQIQAAVENIEQEMRASKKMLFPDWSIVKQDGDGKNANIGTGIDGYIFPIRKKSGVDGSLIDEYCPNVRYSEYSARLNDLLVEYQAQMGVRDLVTQSDGSAATATEIKTKNADNMALEQAIRREIRKGNIMTLESDALYLGIPQDAWAYDEDYQDIYVDDAAKLNEIITVMNNGAAEVDDLVKYYFPTLSDEERAEKIARINESKQAITESSILSALNM